MPKGIKRVAVVVSAMPGQRRIAGEIMKKFVKDKNEHYNAKKVELDDNDEIKGATSYEDIIKKKIQKKEEKEEKEFNEWLEKLQKEMKTIIENHKSINNKKMVDFCENMYKLIFSEYEKIKNDHSNKMEWMKRTKIMNKMFGI